MATIDPEFAGLVSSIASPLWRYIADFRVVFRCNFFMLIIKQGVSWWGWGWLVRYLFSIHFDMRREYLNLLLLILWIWFLYNAGLTALTIHFRGSELVELFFFLFLLFVMMPIMFTLALVFFIPNLTWCITKFLFSKVCVIRTPRYRQRTQGCVSGCKSHLGELCPTCDLLIDSSPLLTGTRGFLTLPVETHFHHTARDLQDSAKSCRLCNFLLHSIKHTPILRPTLQYGSISIPPTNNKLTLKLWEERPFGQKPLLRIRLDGDDISDPVPLTVEEVHKGRSQPEDPFREPADVVQDTDLHECDVSYTTDSRGVME